MNKIAVVFPGQGSQFVGMGKSLCQQFPSAVRVYEEAEDILGIPLRRISFEGRVSELNSLTTLFPAIITYGVASFKVFQEMTGIKADFMAGHSLGEYAALVCSGILDFKDAIRLVEKRASLCLEYSLGEQGSMTVIDGLDADKVDQLCDALQQEGKNVYIACYNKENQLVVSGDTQAVMAIEDMVMEQGANVTPMIMMPPFHCPLLEPITGEMMNLLQSISFHKGETTVIGNVSGMPYPAEKDEIVMSLAAHLVRPVKWFQSMRYMQLHGIRNTIEMGAHNYLSAMIKETIPGCQTYAYGMNQNWDLSGVLTSQSSQKRNISKEYMKIAVSTKNYSKNTLGYDEQIIKAYRELESICKNRNGTSESDDKARKLLFTILDLKEVPEHIRTQYLEASGVL